VIQPGDSLRSIAAMHLPPDQRTDEMVTAYWPRVYDANRASLGGNPDLIHPGVELIIPPLPALTP
jgi:nucleoid-associated protein YgaU